MLTQLLAAWKSNRKAWAGLQQFNRLSRAERRIVFYAETSADWAHLEPVVQSLERQHHPVARICSDIEDPALRHPHSFYVGFGGPRTILFRTLQASAFVMTLSDLETFHLKRSVHPVHYFYIFHSIASTHRVYQLHAFDAYDTVLCVGPHHEKEIRRTEEIYGLNTKCLKKHGYGRLDTLIRDMEKAVIPVSSSPEAPLRVLVAPTWGASSLVHHGLESLVDILLRAGFQVTLRFHPMTRRHFPRLATELEHRFSSTGLLSVDPHIHATESLLNADIMISEWSGSPLEYAFARLRPVLFIDTPPKINNPEHARLNLPYLEDDIRGKIGRIVSPSQISEVPSIVRDLVAHATEWSEKILSTRAETVFNVGTSGDAGAQAILNELNASGTHQETT